MMNMRPTLRDEAIQENFAKFVATKTPLSADHLIFGLFAASADPSLSVHTYDFCFNSFDDRGYGPISLASSPYFRNVNFSAGPSDCPWRSSTWARAPTPSIPSLRPPLSLEGLPNMLP